MLDSGKQQALLLVDHGSRRDEANDSVEFIAGFLRQRCPHMIVRIAHMELALPDIPTAITDCVREGAREIIIHPYMLSPGKHVTEDIPRIVQTTALSFPEVSFRITPPLGIDARLADVILERAGIEPESP